MDDVTTLRETFGNDDAEGQGTACQHADLDGLDEDAGEADHVYCNTCGMEFPVEGSPDEKRRQLETVHRITKGATR